VECPYCGKDSRVLDSRGTSDEVRRRRECLDCKRRFTTYERHAAPEIRVQKRGDREAEAFDRQRLVRVALRVTKGRGVEAKACEDLARRIEAKLVDEGAKLVSWKLLAELLRARLAELDVVSAARFASNYDWDEDGAIREQGDAPSPQLALPNVPAFAPADEPEPRRRRKKAV
jgi:transcriptional repressor NrdR